MLIIVMCWYTGVTDWRVPFWGVALIRALGSGHGHITVIQGGEGGISNPAQIHRPKSSDS